jgi:membrane-bound metal-dependent hydrolase YbcI (DUF457 family)
LLIAHVVPGYFAAAHLQTPWEQVWSKRQRTVLWAVALISTVAPDFDTLYNGFFRDYVGHSLPWTHSIFVYLSAVLLWWLLGRTRRWPYLRTLVGLVAIGGLSHLFLDVVSHGTRLLYPVSSVFIGAPSPRVSEGGYLEYLTDPIFLAEPLLLAAAAAHWIIHRRLAPRITRWALVGLASVVIVFSADYLLWLPTLQRMVDMRVPAVKYEIVGGPRP